MVKHPQSAIIWKDIGETPLEALERYRASQINDGRTEFSGMPMTYAGRLDPMAEGELIILWGDECRNKEKYLGLDKEYEVEIIFGITTDTYDALGMAKLGGTSQLKNGTIERLDLSKYVGKCTEAYPPYSSKTFKGKQLHELARARELPEEMPTKETEIYSIEVIPPYDRYDAQALKARILSTISLVMGDFRQEAIMKRWNEVLEVGPLEYPVLKIRVKCSSGTYMRSLAHRIGIDVGIGAFALSIKRTKIFH